MQDIESTIVELGSIFQQLAHMVKEQEETVQRWATWPYKTILFALSVFTVWQSLLVKLSFLFPDRIDANVEDTHLNVDLAHSEILKYFQSVSNNRWLLIKIFLILVIFFIVFVVFMAWQLQVCHDHLLKSADLRNYQYLKSNFCRNSDLLSLFL